MSVRTAKIKVSGIAAIDTIKERKGDIFIRNISLRYIATGNTSYPYWQIDTDNGTVYVETIK